MNTRLFCLLVLGAFLGSARAADVTAFNLAHAGNPSLPADARDNVIEIHSEKSKDKLLPEVWSVKYYDPTVLMRQTQLKFESGQMVKVTHPKPFLSLLLGTKKLAWRKLKVDSDMALALALQQPQLQGLTVRATQFALVRTPTDPIWKIKFWAASPSHPEKTGSAGQITISAQNGHVLKNKLHAP